MTSRGSGYYGVAAIDALAREAARAPVPPVDWDRVEQRLFATLEAADRLPKPALPAVASRTIGSPWSIALAAAAAVAVVRFAAPGDAHKHGLAPVGAVVSAAPGAGTLSAPLKRGDVAQAGAESIRYEARGAVTFTLLPASRVQVLSDETAPAAASPAMTVALLEGSIHAEVVPHSNGEVFAVEVEQTRIAAHGTSFTVSRDGDRVVVEIAHGSVAVGPAGHPGSTHGWLLVGPDKASFSLDGATEATWLGEPSPSKAAPVADEGAVAELEAAPAAPAIAADEGVELAVPAARPNRRAEAAPRSRVRSGKAAEGAGEGANHGAAVAGILARLNACYERQVASFGVRFSIRSSLTLTVLPNGTVREGVFDPPLSPTLMTCARDAIAAVRFPQDSATTVRVPVVLSPAP